MDINTAINNILRNYGTLAAVNRQQLEKIFNNGLKSGLTVKQMYNGMRLVYGINFHQAELFSLKEAAEMLELSENDLLEKLQKQSVEPEQTKGNVYYFPKGL